jgi:hypothetical protein
MNADNGTVILLDLLLTLRQDRCKRDIEISFQAGLITHSLYPFFQGGGNRLSKVSILRGAFPCPIRNLHAALSLGTRSGPRGSCSCSTARGSPSGGSHHILEENIEEEHPPGKPPIVVSDKIKCPCSLLPDRSWGKVPARKKT